MAYHVTCNTDDNYAQHCCAMLCSLFENNKDIKFHVHILTCKLSNDNTILLKSLVTKYNNELSIYEVDESKLNGVKFRNKRPLTKAAYYRLLLPEILPNEIETIFYLDCDIIILDSVKEIFKFDIADRPLAACVDAGPYTSEHRRQLGLGLNEYAFCSGVMLINIKYWRETNAMNDLIAFSKKDRGTIYLHDQDALNYVFRNKWLMLPPIWNRGVMSFFQIFNSQKWFDYADFLKPKLIHYASNNLKPWYNVNFPEKEYYIKYLKLSGFPNPKFDDRTSSQKRSVYIATTNYYISKYIYPFIPNVVEILIFDIIFLLSSLFYMVFNHKKLEHQILKRRLLKRFIK